MRMQRVLRSDVGRHYLAIGVLILVPIVVVAVVVVLVRVFGVEGALEVARRPIALTFFSLACYGPLYLLLTHFAFRGLEGRAFRDRLRTSATQSRLVRMLLVGGPKSWAIGIAVLGCIAVGSVVLDPEARSNVFSLAASLALLAGTWVLLVAIYAVEYARAWANGDAFRFPGDQDAPLRLADFIYLAVQISTTFSSSDVEAQTTAARRMVTAHSIVAFAYNTVIVAVFVSALLAIALG